MESTESDPLNEAVVLVEEATLEGIPIRMVGGLAVRYLTPHFPPRARKEQDLDLASIGSARPAVTKFLADRGYVGDKMFNNLHGHKQMYFQSPDGVRAMDVMIDRVDMCHVLEFKDRIDRLPYTLDITDLLLSKLQIVELNEKDAKDALYLLAAHPVEEGDEPGTIGLSRISKILGEDWGWWRTVTHNLDRVAELKDGDDGTLVPNDAPLDAAAQARSIRDAVDRAPKTLKWKLRSKVGDRVLWYKLPEEVAH